MFAIPGIALLIAIIYGRPQELVATLRAVPLLYIVFALTIFGAIVDLRLGNTRLRSTPLLGWIALFVFWSLSTLLIREPHGLPIHGFGLLVCTALYVVIAHGTQTLRGLGVVAGAVLAMALFVSSVAAEQRFAPTQCIVLDDSPTAELGSGKPDGRPCAVAKDCFLGDPEPGAEYACENVGWLGATSVHQGRIRYRGVLQDPNELALVGAISLPFAFAFGRGERHTLLRRSFVVIAFALLLACSVMTGSRGGQLVFLAVLAVYFARRFGLRGLVWGAVLALPVLLMGGRGGEEAAGSARERIEAWAEALSMFRSHPILGVGLDQFGQYHYLTAHNSYLLALAELGLPGMVLFSIVLYLAVKICVAALALHVPDAERWALALLAAFAGVVVGIFFLSFAYHYVLWIYLGLAGALYSAIRTHDETFSVRFGWRDLWLVLALDFAIIVLVHLYARVTFA